MGRDHDNSQWEKGYGWGQGQGQQEADWGEKQEQAYDQWGFGDAGRDDLDSQGHTDNEGWNDGTGHQNHQQNWTSPFLQPPTGGSPYSRTMAYANGTAGQMPLDSRSPSFTPRRNTFDSYAHVEPLEESHGEAIEPVRSAFFGRDRKARDRIHWQFPFDKDERVLQALEWLHGHNRSVAVFGVSIPHSPMMSSLSTISQLTKFLQTRERGALFINASYDGISGTGPPVAWLTYEAAVETRDRLLQESIGFYDPSMQVIVFVFLPSKTGNSLAMWRRKIPVPDSIRLPHLREIDFVKAALNKDYTVLVDEMR
jgi:hypothetical protein